MLLKKKSMEIMTDLKELIYPLKLSLITPKQQWIRDRKMVQEYCKSFLSKMTLITDTVYFLTKQFYLIVS